TGASTNVLPASVARLPVDVVCPDDHVLRHLDAEPRRSLEIDRQLDGWDFLDGQLGWRRAAENRIDVACTGSTDRAHVEPVGVERAPLDPLLAVRLPGNPRLLGEPKHQGGVVEPE